MKMRKIMVLSLVAIFIISMFSGCAKNTGNTESTKNDEGVASTEEKAGAMGRYLEEEISLPEEMQGILDIKWLDNGNIGSVMMGEEGQTALWTSENYGETWDKQYDISTGTDAQGFVSSATLLGDGSVLSIMYTTVEEYWKFDIQGNKTKIDIALPEIEGMEGMGVSKTFVMRDGETSAEVGEDTQIITDGEIPDDAHIIMEGELPEGVQGLSEGAEVTGEVTGEVTQDMSDREGNDENAVAFEVDSEIGMQNGIRKFNVGENGEIVVETLNSQVLRIDIETGEIVKEYPIGEEEYPIGCTVLGGKIYIETSAGLSCYDLESGDSVEVGEALFAKATRDENTSDMGYMYIEQGGLALTAKIGDATKALYLADNTGVYRQVEDGTVLEQIIDAALTSLSIPNLVVNKMLALEDGSFLVSAVSDSHGKDNLYHYVYSAKAKTTPETEISIYALEDNREIRQAIAMYQKVNPDVMVSLQIGMTGEEGITASDALNTLNTEIMAGKGPDLFVLDGMPIDSYIEKGILEDISDVVEKIEEQNGLLETIKNTYAIASRFSVPYVQGPAKYVDVIKDIATLADASKKAKEATPDKKSFNGYGVEELMSYFYQIDVNNFITPEGKLEKAALQNFLTQAKEIAENNKVQEVAEENLESASIAVGGTGISGPGVDSAMGVAMELLVKEASIGRGEIKTQMDLATILAVDAKMEMNHKLLTDNAGEKILLTNTILGVNSKGEQVEKAKEFMAFCLSKEVQMSEQGMGLPVNKEALTEVLNKDFEDIGFFMSTEGEDRAMQTIEVMIQSPQDADIKEFKDSIVEKTKIGYSNRIVQEIVLEQLMGYVEEQMTLDDAVEAINQKVSLYLSE